jgi:hypothetical protein
MTSRSLRGGRRLNCCGNGPLSGRQARPDIVKLANFPAARAVLNRKI